MFENNDKTLLTARIVLNVAIGIFVVLCIVAGIVLCVMEMLEFGIPLMLVGPFLCWLVWVFARLHLSHLCDIKLIRNKLYGAGNEGLSVFLEEKEQYSETYGAYPAAGGSGAPQPAISKSEDQGAKQSVSDNTARLFKLKELLDSGAITEEEFEREKKKYL